MSAVIGPTGAMPSAGVTVVVPTYNRADSLRATLATLGAQEVPPGLRWDIVVVNNNSRDHTPQVVEEFGSTASVPVRYLFEGKAGKSHALNAGIALATHDFLLFTDDDVLTSRAWVASAVLAVSRWGADGIGGRILLKWPVPPPRWLAGNADAQQNLGLMDFGRPQAIAAPVRGLPAVWGGNMGFRRAVLESLGGFDTTLGPVGDKHALSEDVDVVQRAVQKGWKVMYDPSLLVWHTVAPERMHKAYFRKWAFRYGEAEAKGLRVDPAPRLFGVPRWRYRAAMAAAAGCLGRALLLRDDAFDRQRELFRMLGQAWGLARRARAGR